MLHAHTHTHTHILKNTNLQASFDPNYKTAKDWIRKRPVGPAVLSSTLISGLVGALIEASFPQTVPVNSSLNFIRPLIVGCEVCARIQIESVNETLRNNKNSNSKTATAISTEQKGYEILLSTQVIRVQDDIVIAEGYHTVSYDHHIAALVMYLFLEMNEGKGSVLLPEYSYDVLTFFHVIFSILIQILSIIFNLEQVWIPCYL